MFTTLKKLALGENGNKGLLLRSGILTALITTVFAAIEGMAAGNIWAHLATQKDTLMPMWTSAITIMIGNPSKKG